MKEMLLIQQLRFLLLLNPADYARLKVTREKFCMTGRLFNLDGFLCGRCERFAWQPLIWDVMKINVVYKTELRCVKTEILLD